MSVRCGVMTFLFFISIMSLTAQDKVLTLVYKDVGKIPYMQASPDNGGVYVELLEAAVNKIGFQLVVKRVPKPRTYLELSLGNADIYPSVVFNIKRSEILYFIKNGLHRHEVYYLLTDIAIPDLRIPSDINDARLQWQVEIGSTQAKQAENLGIVYHQTKDISIYKAIRSIQAGRPFCYRVTSSELEHYMHKNNISLMSEIGIKVHKNCFPDLSAPLFVGFSRNSPFYEEEINPYYDKTLPISVENFPYRLVAGSIPDQLQKVLQQMIDNEDVLNLMRKYGVEPATTP